jgi:hypothetical protein
MPANKARSRPATEKFSALAGIANKEAAGNQAAVTYRALSTDQRTPSNQITLPIQSTLRVVACDEAI